MLFYCEFSIVEGIGGWALGGWWIMFGVRAGVWGLAMSALIFHLIIYTNERYHQSAVCLVHPPPFPKQ